MPLYTAQNFSAKHREIHNRSCQINRHMNHFISSLNLIKMPKTNQQPIQTARILLEALPYIRQYQGATLAIKYGGHAMVHENLKQSFAQDLILMKLIGMNPLVVHGGGPQINRVLERIGKESVFVDGMRVTDTETMDVVEMVLGGLVNKEIVKLINSLGGHAVGLTGKDGNLIKACKLKNKNRNPSSGKEGAIVDFGQVGEVESIDPSIINVLLSRDFIPVIAPIGIGSDGRTYNINSDLVAGHLAATMNASKLMLLTDTPGVLDENGTLIPKIRVSEVQGLINRGIITSGMIPKVQCAVQAINGGVESSLILDGRTQHALLLELLTDSGIGTLICQ